MATFAKKMANFANSKGAADGRGWRGLAPAGRRCLAALGAGADFDRHACPADPPLNSQESVAREK